MALICIRGNRECDGCMMCMEEPKHTNKRDYRYGIEDNVYEDHNDYDDYGYDDECGDSVDYEDYEYDDR